MQIIIVCGGGGTRLWPLSTQAHPKQFVPVVDEESLLEKTYRRLRVSFAAENIWFTTTNADYKQTILDILGDQVDPEKILIEPERRDTFPAEAAAAAVVASRVGEHEPLVFVPCDDFLPREEDILAYNTALQKVADALIQGAYKFVTVGIRPAYANPQLGHLEVAASDFDQAFIQAVPVRSFREKPDLDTAEKFVASGKHFWHKHNPSFTYANLYEALSVLMPVEAEIIQEIYRKGEMDAGLFAKLPKMAIDYAILERVPSIGMVAMDVIWEDIGNWQTVYDYLPDLQTVSDHLQLSGQGNKARLTSADRKVAFVGVSGLLLVESQEGILVIDPRNSAEVKQVSQYFADK